VRFELVREIVEALPRELPAAPAILTPIRLDTPESLQPEGERRGRPSAVLVLLFPDAEGQARVLLTARAARVGAHAGEISFPGGAAEADDADPIATALRESAEEVGLDPAQCGLRVTGGLEAFALTVSGFRITPVVAVADRRPGTRPAPDEVARIIEAPVEAFLPHAPVELQERTIRQRLIRYGAYPIEGEKVWGATARMLGQLGAALAAGADLAAGAALAAGATSAAGAALAAGAVLAEGPLETAPSGTPPAAVDERPIIRATAAADRSTIDAFLEKLAPELAHGLPPASELFLAEVEGCVVGLASWALWDRKRGPTDPRGFEGLEFQAFDSSATPAAHPATPATPAAHPATPATPAAHPATPAAHPAAPAAHPAAPATHAAAPAELTLLAVAPNLRGRGIGRGLLAAVARAAAADHDRLLAWTLADAAVHPSSIAARNFFRASGFTDVAVDRHTQARGEDRLLMSLSLRAGLTPD
jgi:8-oxo-dGTP pyrophosphatase MutT (NUDIX family)/GNAT superfamily N-acetyltransferase